MRNALRNVSRVLSMLTILLALRPPGAAAAGGAVGPLRVPNAAVGDSLRAAYAKDRDLTAQDLKSGATSYLAAVARTDFGDRSALVVGRAADCDLRVDDPAFAAHHLRVTVAGDSFRVEAVDDTAHFLTRQGGPVRSAALPPSFVKVGRFTLRLSHQRFPALIVFDPQSPHFAEYHGLSWYPPDLDYRFSVPLTPNPHADTTIIMSTRGNARRAVLAGWFDLQIQGKAVRLEAHRLLEPGVDERSVSVFFRDATTGKETYAVGRYVDPERLPNGDWLVDFNNAYNPACATSPYYNCPIPSKANTLKVAIRAGEMDSHYAH
jgi:uncharacterized protein (DUF1684 family)